MDTILIITAVLCLAVGLSLGLLGGGGSVLMVPLFVYVAGFSASEAIALSLLIVGLSAAAGVAPYFKQGFVNKRLVVLFVLPGTATAFFGARLARSVPSEALLFMFGLLMVAIAAVFFARSSGKNPLQGLAVCRPAFWLSVTVGAGIGFLTGLLGVGGGFLIVPAIALLMKCSMQTAIGTSLAVIAVNSAGGFVGHLPALHADIPLAALFLAATMAGAFTGTKLSGRIGVPALQQGFALLILVVGALLAARNFPY